MAHDYCTDNSSGICDYMFGTKVSCHCKLAHDAADCLTGGCFTPPVKDIPACFRAAREVESFFSLQCTLSVVGAGVCECGRQLVKTKDQIVDGISGISKILPRDSFELTGTPKPWLSR